MASSAPPDDRSSFPLFDWLRFLLASVVALRHEEIIAWGPAGNFAVQVFFALSGWLIGGILLRTKANRLPRFFFNRGTRIWLPYLVAVGAVYGLAVLRDGITPYFFRFLTFDLTFTHNWFIPKVPEVIGIMPLEGTGTHFWSISVEEQFYLAAPLLIVIFPFGKTLLLWTGICAWAYLTKSWYAAISFGVLAAVAQERFGNWHLTSHGRTVLLAALGALAISLVTHPQAYEWVAPPTAVLIVLVAAVEGQRHSVGSFLGGVSYPLYLHHWIGMFGANYLSKHLSLDPLIRGWLAYSIAVTVGIVAYVTIDRNIQRYRGQLFTQARGKAFAAAAYLLMAAGIVIGLTATFDLTK